MKSFSINSSVQPRIVCVLFLGAFLVPYVIMVFLIGFPLMYLEFVFGQYGGCGIVSVWKACPTLTGKT